MVITQINVVSSRNLSMVYGLRQVYRKCYEKLSTLLLSFGYQQVQVDHGLFIKAHGNTFIALIFYVDDIVLTGNSTTEIAHIKHILHSYFHIKVLAQLKYFFLGLKVAHSYTSISLCQVHSLMILFIIPGLSWLHAIPY